jgi:hypothetical protein
MTTTHIAPHNPLFRLTGISLALGGVLGAAFVIVSQGELIGALSMLSQRWTIAHNLHFASAALLLFGVVGLYLSHNERMSVSGHLGFVVALLGTGFYFATGVLTAAILPLIAGVAPMSVSHAGPLFSPTLPALVVSVLVFQMGWFGIGLVVARAGVLPAWTGVVTAIGALLGMIPPRPFGPAPWIVIDIAWIVFAIGLVGMGIMGWRRDAGSQDSAVRVASAA